MTNAKLFVTCKDCGAKINIAQGRPEGVTEIQYGGNKRSQFLCEACSEKSEWWLI